MFQTTNQFRKLLTFYSCIPSGNQTWQWKIHELNGGFQLGKNTELNSVFSSQPCLMTPEAIPSTNQNISVIWGYCHDSGNLYNFVWLLNHINRTFIRPDRCRKSQFFTTASLECAAQYASPAAWTMGSGRTDEFLDLKKRMTTGCPLLHCCLSVSSNMAMENP